MAGRQNSIRPALFCRTLVTTVSPLWLHHADRVVLLHDGTVVAEGDHAQLLEENPTYRHLVARGLDEVTVEEAGR